MSNDAAVTFTLQATRVVHGDVDPGYLPLGAADVGGVKLSFFVAQDRGAEEIMALRVESTSPDAHVAYFDAEGAGHAQSVFGAFSAFKPGDAGRIRIDLFDRSQNAIHV